MNTPVEKHNPFATPAGSMSLISVEQQRAVAEVQASMIVARSMPRDVRRSIDRILMECTNPELAEDATYEYNRGGSSVKAPSIRLAETMARHWGNIQTGVRELSRREGYSECQSYAQDLESGYKEERTFQVRHWRDTKKGGYAVDDERDIYEVVANMGARRKRACILAMIPLDIQTNALDACEKTLLQRAEVTPERIQGMIDKFAEFKVTKDMIERRIQRHVDALTPGLLVSLGRVFNSLKDGMSNVEDWFEAAPADSPEPPKTGAAGLAAAVKEKGKRKKQDPQPGQGSNAASPQGTAGAADTAKGPTPEGLLGEVEKCCGKARDSKDSAIAYVCLDDAADLARALEGDLKAKAEKAINDTLVALDAKFKKA